MEIGLEHAAVTPGSVLRGTLTGAPDDGAEVTIYAQTTNPFSEDVHEASTTLVHNGPFELTGPRWPLSAHGPLLGVRWWIEAHGPDGVDSAAAPFDLVSGDVEIESLANDDLDEPRRGPQSRVAIISAGVLVVAIVGVVTRFGTDATIVRVFSAIVGGLALLAVVDPAHDVRGLRLAAHEAAHDVECGDVAPVFRPLPQRVEDRRRRRAHA